MDKGLMPANHASSTPSLPTSKKMVQGPEKYETNAGSGNKRKKVYDYSMKSKENHDLEIECKSQISKKGHHSKSPHTVSSNLKKLAKPKKQNKTPRSMIKNFARHSPYPYKREGQK